jgi:8-oxo-dGTP pyrophosphatase MutT (NUDIX family)
VNSSLGFEEAVKAAGRALAGKERRTLALPKFRSAAVLIPILRRPEGPTLLFTRRTESVAEHKGQISFPGGRLEDGENAIAAALREAEEEVGLEPSRVEVAGCLDDRASVSWYVVTPVIGIVREPPASFRPQAAEVVSAFEVPLRYLLDRERVRHEWWDVSRMPPGAPAGTLLSLSADREIDRPANRYKVYFFDAAPMSHEPIWGLTARILKEFLDASFGFSLG